MNMCEKMLTENEHSLDWRALNNHFPLNVSYRALVLVALITPPSLKQALLFYFYRIYRFTPNMHIILTPQTSESARKLH